MAGVIFLLYILSLVSGSATLGMGLGVYLKYRKAVIKWFLWFLFSLFLIALSFVFQYMSPFLENVFPDFSLLAGISGKTGSIGFICSAPLFFFSLLGIHPGRRLKILLGMLALFSTGLFIADLFVNDHNIILILLMLLFLGIILFGLIIVGVHFGTIAEKSLRRALLVFFIITALFVPLFLIDMNLHRFGPGARIRKLDNMSQPLYFLILNCSCIFLVIKYLSQPSLRKDGKLTDYFLARFGISEREAGIIEKLLLGMSSKEIGEAVFISPKTVDNHIYNIFQKLNIRNRLQLVQMVNSGSE
ncbi:MAG: helix-turn-helix transcriptional regulator [Spirochaetales bacterium]|nr:helix-turn-helix transcriptional regulator [Spirochaetales bacterium]